MMKFVQTKFGKLAYSGKLTGKPIIIAVHGLGGSAAYFQAMIPYLTQYDVLAFNLLGTPPSDNTEDNVYTVEKAAMSLWTAIDTLNIKSPLILMGHSLGGSIVEAMLAQRVNQVQALVLISTSTVSQYIHLNPLLKLLGYPIISPILQNIMKLAKRPLAYRSLLDATNVSDPSFLIEPMIQKKRRVIKQELTLFARYTTTMSMDKRLSVYNKVPTLVIFGDHDKLATDQRRLNDQQRYSKLSQVTFVTVPMASHVVLVEKPAVVSKIVNKFLISAKQPTE
ncbi:alpha/beta fold hydrolase [Pediococcus ethanolidurans]|nr:alpha/beta fold hydrolase [Pediococcus ethanolidurans]